MNEISLSSVTGSRDWHERSYREQGTAAQRAYPNEELARFVRGVLAAPASGDLSDLRLLELGSGSGGNLWMTAREGFDSHGIDLAHEANRLAAATLETWSVQGRFVTGDMSRLPYRASVFDVVLDVFSAYCLPEAAFERCIQEVARILKADGWFFCYTPSKASDAFREPGPSRLLDPSTLDGIRRESSPYHGNLYPFRFITAEELRQVLEVAGFQIQLLETTGRTYRTGSEYFEFIVAAATLSEA